MIRKQSKCNNIKKSLFCKSTLWTSLIYVINVFTFMHRSKFVYNTKSQTDSMVHQLWKIRTSLPSLWQHKTSRFILFAGLYFHETSSCDRSNFTKTSCETQKRPEFYTSHWVYWLSKGLKCNRFIEPSHRLEHGRRT